MSQRFVEVVTSRKIIARGLLWYIMFFFLVRTSVFAFDCSYVKRICHLKDNLETFCESQNNSSCGVHRVEHINSPKWVNFYAATKCSGNNKIEVIKCDIPLSTTNLREITQMLRATSVKKLTCKNPHSKNPMLMNLQGFDNLKELEFIGSLTFCHRNLLANLPNLTIFQLLSNNISFIPPAFFNHTTTLEKFILIYSNLQSIEPGTFDNFKFLKMLIMKNNNFTQFSSGIFDQLTALEILDISSNNLNSLSENILAKLANMEIIILSSNNFTKLPKDLFRNNTKLQEIYISYNEAVLTTLPREFFSNFTMLRKISLYSNGIVTLSEDLFWGTLSLIKIMLSNNRLKSLPPNIFRDTKHLILLELDMNELEKLPEYIFKNTNRLQILNLAQNRISSISRDTFKKLYDLKELNMENNILTTISVPLLSHLHVKIVRFSHNHLTLQSLKNLTLSVGKLEKIYLDHNNISGTFNLKILEHLKLQELDMKYNEISVLNLTYFGYAKSNIQINLTYNKIKHIHLTEDELIRQFRNKQNIVNIFVDNNPIICDCSLYNYLRYVDGRMNVSIQTFLNIRPRNLSCDSPKWLKNVKVMDLPSRTLECKAQDTNLNIPCARECDCILRPEDNEWRIDCSGKNLTQVPRDVKDPGKPYKLGLNFSENMLKKMPNLTELNLQSARLLDLSYNSISEVSKYALPVVVEVLKLHNNNISRIHSDVLELLKKSTNLTILTLHGNPWECDCEAKDFLNFIQTKYVNILNLSEVTCYGRNYSILNMTMDNFCPGEMELFIVLNAMIPVVLIAIVGIIIGVFRFYQRDIKVWLFTHQWCLCFVTEEELDKDKLYDAFISYSHKDQDFVENVLIPTLESGPKPFKLCLHYRDWLAGEWIPEQIAKSVEDSKRTIVVLSPNFLESMWGRMELRAAHSQALSEGRTRIIPILYSDIGSTDNMDPELKAYISMNTYIKWGDPWFWDKLKYALPHSPKSASAAGRTIFENYQPTQSRETSM